jgi:hypothetical protein
MTPSAIAVLVSMAIAGGGGGPSQGGAITWQSVSAVSKVGTVGTQNVTYQSGITSGERLYLVHVLRTSTNEQPSNPTGWGVPIISLVGGVSSWAPESGDARITVWEKIASGTESGGADVTITWTDNVNSAALAFIIRLSGANAGWQTTLVASGEDETGPSIAVTGSALNLFVNDLIIAIFATNTSNGAPTSQSLSAGSVVLGSTTDRVNDSTFIAYDAAVDCFTAAVSSSPGSGAPSGSLTYSEGATPATTGPMVFIVARNAP